jgi:uncharacterized damage-inducible protein DinB
MSALSLLKDAYGHKRWIGAQFFEALAKVDEAAHAETRHTAIRLMNHIHVVDRIFAGHLAGRPHGYSGTNTPETPSLAALRDATAASDDGYLALIEALDESQLDEPVHFSFTDGDAGCMTRGEMLMHVALHGSYHRGAVGRLLVQAGVPAPRDLLTRYLHQTQPERRAT